MIDSARFDLRAATAPHHERVDAVFATADLSDRASYGRFLTAQAAAHLPVETALDRGGAAAIIPDWAARRRAAALIADLDALGLPVPVAAGAPSYQCPAAILGAAYVLEGSRLGGAMLKRLVPQDFPCDFLGAVDSGGWRRLVMVLDQHLDDAEARRIAIDTARGVFELFAESGRRHLGNEVGLG